MTETLVIATLILIVMLIATKLGRLAASGVAIAVLGYAVFVVLLIFAYSS